MTARIKGERGLLDINVIALFDSNHIYHQSARDWCSGYFSLRYPTGTRGRCDGWQRYFLGG